jgi:putative transposase
LAYNLNFRKLEVMMAERGISVDHATIHKWVTRYSPHLLEQLHGRKRPVSREWHINETYIKVCGQWRYLYQAIDSDCDTVEFWFSGQRNLVLPKGSCARRSSGTARESWHWRQPDQSQTILSCGTADRLRDRSRRKLKSLRIGQSRYLNNRVEQDHRAIKRQIRPMLGFKSTISARVTLGGIEMAHKMHKGQADHVFSTQLSLAELLDVLAA